MRLEGNRLTFGKEPENKFGQGDKLKLRQQTHDSPGVIQEEDEGKSNIKQIHTSTGKRKQVVKTEEDSYKKLEHTFGDDGSLSMRIINNGSRNDDSRRSESKRVDSSIPWNSKADISLSTDSIFNLQDDDMRQFLKEDKIADSSRRIVNNGNSAKKPKQQSAEVAQMLKFMSMIEELWQGLVDGKHASALKFQKKGSDVMGSSATQRQSRLEQIPQEISSKLTHQITQVSVYYQLNCDKPDFRIPTKRVS